MAEPPPTGGAGGGDRPSVYGFGPSWVWIAVAVVMLVAAPLVVGEGGAGARALVDQALSWVLHLDKNLSSLIANHGTWTYAVLFAIVFCETGLVVTPFLPGDSLLFACGAFCALGALKLPLILGLLFVAGVLGDALNYSLGAWVGTRAIESGLLKREYIDKTEEFYEKYGGKTVVLARFVPIVRTFAPFVAGVGSMEYPKFAQYNVAGAALWVGLFTGAGFFFGNLPFVQHNFTLVVLAIVALSVLPIVYEIITARREAAK